MNPAEFRQLRQIFTERFTADDFNNFCFDHFYEVYRNFTTGQTQSQRIELLLNHALAHACADDLTRKLVADRPDLADALGQPPPAASPHITSSTPAAHVINPSPQPTPTPAPAMSTPPPAPAPVPPRAAFNDKIAAFTFGIVGITALLVLAIAFPNPTPFQEFAFRTFLALCAAGLGAVLPGVLNISMAVGDGTKNFIRAGGAIALFVIVYKLNPPALVNSTPPTPTTSTLSGTIFAPDRRTPQPGLPLSALGYQGTDGRPLTGRTAPDGTFTLTVPAPPGSTVRLTATLGGDTVLNYNATTNQPFQTEITPTTTPPVQP